MIELIETTDDPRLEAYRHVGDPQWLLDRDLFVAEGRLVVERLVEEGTFTIASVLLTPPALAALGHAFPPGLTVYVATPTIVRHITGFDFHRGCLALAVRRRESAVEALAGARRLVILEGVGNPDNIGGIFRSAAGLGAGGVALDRGCADPLYRKAIRTSMGAVLRLPFARVERWPEAIADFRRMGFRIVALTPSAALTIDEFAGTLDDAARIAFLAGAEGPGLTAAALARADVAVRIPVDPRSDSLNVVVAVSIALHSTSRR